MVANSAAEVDRAALAGIYRRLFEAFGPQQWWPTDGGAFEIAVGAVLTQNTAWTNVERAVDRLVARDLLGAETMLRVPEADLADAIRPSGYFNVKAGRLRALARAWLDAGGEAGLAGLPTEALRRRLLGVHGIGRETADDIVLYAFHRPVFVVDAYTRRIVGRVGAHDPKAAYDELRVDFERALEHDTQALNECHALIVRLGKDVCRPRPRCDRCPLAGGCAYARSAQPC